MGLKVGRDICREGGTGAQGPERREQGLVSLFPANGTQHLAAPALPTPCGFCG